MPRGHSSISLDRLFCGFYGGDDVFQLDAAAIEKQLELSRRKALYLRDTSHQDIFGQQVGGEKSRAELPSGGWLSCAVFLPILRGDLLDKETNILR